MTKSTLRGSTVLLLLLATASSGFAQEAGVDLGTITLTGGKRDIATGPVPVTVIDEEEIKDRQAGTIGQLIDSVPGVTLINNGSTPQGSGINIRGFGANTTFGTDQKVAVQIDGASVGSEELYRIGTQMFTDPFLYRKVEVLRGTIGSYEYGSGIVGGVVKMETKNASDLTGGQVGVRFGQTIELSSNRKGLASSSTLAWQATDRVGFLLNYSHRKQDDQKDGAGNIIGNTGFETPSWLFKAHANFGESDDHSLTFSVSQTTADDKDVPYDTFATTGGFFGNVDRKTDTRQAALRYRWNPADTDMIDLEATLSYADQKIDYTYVPGSSPLERSPSWPFLRATVNGEQRYETTKLTVKNTSRFNTGTLAHTLRSGVELIHKERADNAAAGAPGGKDSRVAFFMIDEMKTGGLTITPALRWESSKVKDTRGNTFKNDAAMGGLALGYAFGNGVELFGSAAYTVGLPIIDDVGNAMRMAMPEKSRTLEVGASYTGENVFATGDTFTVRAGFYDTKLWDITSYTVFGSTSINLASVKQHGFELEASYGLESGLYFDANAHIGNGKEYNPDGTSRIWRNLPADALGLTVGKRWDDRFDLSWEVVYKTNKRDSRGANLPSPTVHNLRATFRPQQGVFDGTELRLGVEDVFDKAYTGHFSSPSRKAPGRTFKFTVSKLF